MDENKELWQKCAAFHGHVCGGLTIGYKAAIYAIELLGITFSEDEDVVCVSENDACGVDAIQVILGCSIGKGNLLFHMTGKQAFNFYDRKNEKSVRLIVKKKPEGMTREQSFDYFQGLEPCEMFDVKDAKILLPEPARLFDSYECECCGETAGANWIRIQSGKRLCVDCSTKYNRFDV
ncbi:formylmethanofuran dehydrogenase subunit E [Ruminiclostridium sufflavum DSM 19573]|uniref:Formylmethanofuran dehydrogenase subunit E n=1 Tax=Ruminiclostridium sufflavum DSM 19573 TaxID=1121337 RepID=A0A318Y0Z7_9FIRM|nr:FmdE family protein [Ruminiclostridium sufflavum]PYG84344.1 formylmethanofuran dehydrogenase subunit E [Ruminiclostridium sufflavum DSM 19573]